MAKRIFFSSPRKKTSLALFLCLWCSLTFLGAGNAHPSRVSYLDGSVEVSHQGQHEWSLVAMNFPVWEGDRFVLQENSRVEIEFNDGSVLRLGPGTDLIFQKLSKDEVELQLLLGDLILRRKTSTLYVVFTTSASTYVEDEGHYRFSVSEPGQTIVQVRKGIARIVHASVAMSLYSGVSWISDGSGGHFTQVSQIDQGDSFDRWSDRRDAERLSHELSSFPEQIDYAGSHDLGRYGQWGYVSTYGRVWWPNQISNWIPYQKGRWIYGPSGGLVWISHEPWGWLPYHYGSWVFVPYYSRWCWIPGRFFNWWPALVHFYYGNGYWGWIPKGPKDATVGTRGSHPKGKMLGAGRGLTMVRSRDFLKGKISPHEIVRNRTARHLRPGLPLGLKIQTPSASSTRRVHVRQLAGERSAQPLARHGAQERQRGSRLSISQQTFHPHRTAPATLARTRRANSKFGTLVRGERLSSSALQRVTQRTARPRTVLRSGGIRQSRSLLASGTSGRAFSGRSRK